MENNHSSALLSKEYIGEKAIAIPFDTVSFDAGQVWNNRTVRGWQALLRAVAVYPDTEDTVDTEFRRKHQNHGAAW